MAINLSKKPVKRSRPYGKWMIFIKLSNSTALFSPGPCGIDTSYCRKLKNFDK
jgi:hypothetical protein